MLSKALKLKYNRRLPDNDFPFRPMLEHSPYVRKKDLKINVLIIQDGTTLLILIMGRVIDYGSSLSLIYKRIHAVNTLLLTSSKNTSNSSSFAISIYEVVIVFWFKKYSHKPSLSKLTTNPKKFAFQFFNHWPVNPRAHVILRQ